MNPEALLRKYSRSEESFQIILGHSKKVTEIALRIASKVKVAVDKGFIHDAAMLHDIGRFKHPPGNMPGLHGVAGAEIMRKEGYPAIARVCERHLAAGITKEVAKKLGLPEREYFPETVEEKIICYADRLADGDREIPIEEELARFKAKFEPGSVTLLKKLHNEIMGLMA